MAEGMMKYIKVLDEMKIFQQRFKKLKIQAMLKENKTKTERAGKHVYIPASGQFLAPYDL